MRETIEKELWRFCSLLNLIALFSGVAFFLQRHNDCNHKDQDSTAVAGMLTNQILL